MGLYGECSLVCITMINQEERWIWWEIWGGARRLEEDHDSHLVCLPQVPPGRRPCSSSSVYVDESSSGSTTAAVVKRAQQRAARENQKLGSSREARMVVFIGGSSTWIHLDTLPRSGGHGIVGVGCVFFPFVYFFNPSWLNHGNVGVLACFFFYFLSLINCSLTKLWTGHWPN